LKRLILIIIPLFFFVSCTKKKIPYDESLLGLDYYPTKQGKYVIYDVDSTWYTLVPQKDTFEVKYRIKEKIADSFTDAQGQPAIRLERYVKMYSTTKSYDSIPWTIKEVWMVNADKVSIQVSERDIRYTKLIFPVQENATWKGNARNNIGDWDYTYNYVDKKETINNVSLDKVLLVKQIDFDPLIYYKKYSEKYAKGVGLVYREMYDVQSNNVVAGVATIDRIETGFIYKQSIVSYGYE
jgi:hypothetical protein